MHNPTRSGPRGVRSPAVQIMRTSLQCRATNRTVHHIIPTLSGMESRGATPGQPESSRPEGPIRSKTDYWVLSNEYLPLYPGFGL